MSMQHINERREHSRLALNRLVLVTEDSGNLKKLVGVNYSVGGMALNSRQPLSSGEFVELQFWLTEPKNKEVNMTAEVIHNSKQGDIYITSVKFVGELQLN
ncbi:MAG: PilZ domain-containing protein [Gammaproteobacteria bacterium]|nr:PilZ domain-containing protein [Gammaproteobacteria bacterium]MCW8987393.1 PilZ domain-containing protein [Gammaproteobacteria bacterium]